MAGNVDSSEIFNNLSSKITNLLHGRTEGDRSILNKALDDLNSLNYRYTIVTNPTKAVLLVNQCCNFISTDDDQLVKKYSLLLWNLVNRQNVPVEGRSLIVAINWCLDSALNNKDKNVILEILQALDALLRINIDQIIILTQRISDVVVKFVKEGELIWSPEIILLALQCLEASTAVPTDPKVTNNAGYLENCAKIFISHLSKVKIVEDHVHIKILQISLYGLQNVLIQNPDYLKRELGLILGIIKSFMVYGIKGIDFMPPQKLVPSTLSIPEAPVNLREKKGGKITKQRKHRISTGPKKVKSDISQENVFDKSSGYSPVSATLEVNSDSGINIASSSNRLKTSDSDFSDNDSNKLAKIMQTQSKVRQASFSLFYNIIKNTEKSTIFSYWTNFIPEGTVLGTHNLITCILKDPSSRCRIAVLNVLLILLTSSKLYLSHAEYSEKNASFTSFSMVLGLTIKELHKGLCLALTEKSVPVLVQLLKCLAALVQATPYHRMGHALITKVVRNVKPFVYYKDTTVQVTALIVLGCVLASEPIVPETRDIMLKTRFDNVQVLDTNTDEDNDKKVENIDFAEFSESDDDDVHENCIIPWLLKKCLSNLGVQFDEIAILPDEKDIENKTSSVSVPVKLESLQVISAVCRNYFDLLIAPYLLYIVKGITLSLNDQYTDLKLHAGRCVDFIGQAICRCITSSERENYIPSDQFLSFWQTLLNGPLIDLLQCEDNPILRSIGCDCLGSIGSDIFEQLPRDKQILCVTQLFSCTRDEENIVKAAAVRALAICVMYSTLREDPGFVVDTAEAIYILFSENNLMVRIKSSWSLGNLSDALVLNNKSEEGIEEIPHELILKLLQISIKGTSDNDKIKMNVVRALGNLLQLLNSRLIEKVENNLIIEKAFEALVKCCTSGSNMKVRWNACYAIGNALKNSALYQSTPNRTWQVPVYKALMELVVSFKNFKVRINAALALSAPTNRDQYGNCYYPTWTALLTALENSQNIEDSVEYIHRDHLIEQLCLSLAHLASLLRKDDLLPIQDTVELYFEIFHGHTQKVLERLIPEKSSTITNASFALNKLSKEPGLTTNEINVLDRLKLVFVPIL